MSKPTPDHRDAYPHFLAITTRWMDNDVYAHVNNVVYYSYFDTVVADWLISRGIETIKESPFVGLVVETMCQYFSPVSFPDLIHAGLRVAKLGNSSVRYEIGLFRNDEPLAAAQGHFVHVYVDRITRRPVAGLPETLKAALAPLLIKGTPS